MAKPYQTTIRLHDTDAAGVVYFASVFRIAHEAYEDFLGNIGFRLARMMKAGDVALPIVHAEADYALPLRLGEMISIEATVDQVGRSSFGMRYRLLRGDKTCAVVQTVHVAIDPTSGKKRPLPSGLRNLLVRAQG